MQSGLAVFISYATSNQLYSTTCVAWPATAPNADVKTAVDYISGCREVSGTG
jgi:hypothetical protein